MICGDDTHGEEIGGVKNQEARPCRLFLPKSHRERRFGCQFDVNTSLTTIERTVRIVVGLKIGLNVSKKSSPCC
jgi:hypothetical protein